MDNVDIFGVALLEGSQCGGLTEDILGGIVSFGTEISGININDLDSY